MNEELAYEIDFHPVGDGEKGGDAITLRYGKLNSQHYFSQKVIVIDGGSLKSGESIVEHIKLRHFPFILKIFFALFQNGYFNLDISKKMNLICRQQNYYCGIIINLQTVIKKGLEKKLKKRLM